MIVEDVGVVSLKLASSLRMHGATKKHPLSNSVCIVLFFNVS